MKYLSLLAFFFSVSALADTVRIYNVADFTITGTSGIEYELNVDKPSGDATAETAPATVYLPMKNTSIADQDKYLVTSRSGSLTLASGTDTTPINFRLDLSITGSSKYLVAAVKVNGAYYVADRTALINTGTYTNYLYTVSPYDFCSTFVPAGSTSPCNDGANFTTTMNTYFFVTATTYAKGDPISAGSDTGGVYYVLKMSNIPPTTTTMTLSNVRIGDRRLIVNYSASSTIQNFTKIKIFKHDAAPAPAADNKPVGDTVNLVGSIMTTDFSGDPNSGELTINELENSTQYYLSLFLVNKYNFTTPVSPFVQGTPVAIEELLKKQACYILTAGFGEEHYVTNYFRDYRDHVLANSWLGRKLIRFYYGTAPKVALTIYQHDSLRMAIRGFAYAVYFLFKFGLLLLLVSFSCYFLNNLRKNKIFLRKNRL